MEDKDIIELFHDKKSKEKAFASLLSKYQERVYWHIRKMVIDHDDANDLTQDTFIKVYKSLEKFRSDSGLFTWLYRIATNECLTFLKKKKRRTLLSSENYQEQLFEQLKADPLITGDEIQQKLQMALLTLPEKQKLVFNMKYFDDMKYDEISKVLHISVGSLKASYHHAVKKIETFLNDH